MPTLLMAVLKQIKYTRSKTKLLFPRCSKLIQSSKNSARISHVFSLRLSDSASLRSFHFFHSFWLACKGNCDTSAGKNMIRDCSLKLLELARYRKGKKHTRIHCFDLAGKYRVHPQSPELGMDILKYPQDNEVFRL